MTRTTSVSLLAFLGVTACALASPTGPSAAAAAVRLTNSHLVAMCLDGTPVAPDDRQWDVTAPASLTVTMRNEPRPGVPNAEPGIAVIAFTPEAGHKYEVEVRSAPMLFSRRVWPRGAWRPVVRDRTTDRVVSSEPRWIDAGCGAPF